MKNANYILFAVFSYLISIISVSVNASDKYTDDFELARALLGDYQYLSSDSSCKLQHSLYPEKILEVTHTFPPQIQDVICMQTSSYDTDNERHDPDLPDMLVPLYDKVVSARNDIVTALSYSTFYVNGSKYKSSTDLGLYYYTKTSLYPKYEEHPEYCHTPQILNPVKEYLGREIFSFYKYNSLVQTYIADCSPDQNYYRVTDYQKLELTNIALDNVLRKGRSPFLVLAKNFRHLNYTDAFPSSDFISNLAEGKYTEYFKNNKDLSFLDVHSVYSVNTVKYNSRPTFYKDRPFMNIEIVSTEESYNIYNMIKQKFPLRFEGIAHYLVDGHKTGKTNYCLENQAECKNKVYELDVLWQ